MKKNELWSITLNLTIACLICGLFLAIINQLTYERILAAEKKVKQDARKSLLPSAVTFEEIPNKKEWYKGLDKDKKLVGYVVPTFGSGYAGKVEMLVGITPDFKVTSIKFLKDAETPGLGDKMKEKSFYGQFTSKGLENMEVTKDPNDTTKIKAITGATISSRAVTEGVKKALEEIKKEVEKK